MADDRLEKSRQLRQKRNANYQSKKKIKKQLRELDGFPMTDGSESDEEENDNEEEEVADDWEDESAEGSASEERGEERGEDIEEEDSGEERDENNSGNETEAQEEWHDDIEVEDNEGQDNEDRDSDANSSSSGEEDNDDGEDIALQITDDEEDEHDIPQHIAAQRSPFYCEIRDHIRKWKLRGKGTREMFDDLLAILNVRCPDEKFPNDCRTLLAKILADDEAQMKAIGEEVEEGNVKKMKKAKSKYAHFGVEKGLLHATRGLSVNDIPEGNDGRREVWFFMYVDGVAKFYSAAMPGEFWPVILRIMNIEYLDCEPVYAGLYYGIKKPIIEEMFIETNVELHQLLTQGLQLRDGHVAVKFAGVVADAPARQMLRGITTHTAYEGCERCTERGQYFKFRVCYPARAHPIPPRTNENFRNQEFFNHHKGECVFAEHEDLDLINLFILDSMHLVYLCVVRRWLFFVTKIKTGPKVIWRLRQKKLREFEADYAGFNEYCPMEFSRKPVDLKDSGHLKANEYRQMANYGLLALLLGRVHKDLSDNFLLLHVALRILSDPIRCLDENDLNVAEDLLQRFVRDCEKLFGLDFVVYGVHNLTHIVDDVRRHRCTLDRLSAFWSENEYRFLLRGITGPSDPITQAKNIIQQKTAYDKEKFPNGPRQKARKKPKYQCSIPMKGVENVGRYVVMTTPQVKYHCERLGDRYTEVEEDGEIIFIECTAFIDLGADLNDEERYRVEGQQLEVIDGEFYVDPMPASELGIRLTNNVKSPAKSWPMSSVKRKIYRLPLYKSDLHVLMPLLHSSEY
jgi:hypothetical protein